MDTIFARSDALQKSAWEIITETRVVETWQSIGATINLVGSLKTGLMMNHRDIDFHIYTDPFNLADSFTAMARLAENPRFRSSKYINYMDQVDRCVEWHAKYLDSQGDTWQIDMIHFLPDSAYVGYFERVAERISALLTPETRAAILQIKDAVPEGRKVMGIQVYRAVIEAGIRRPEDFWPWLEQHSADGIVNWMP